MVPPGNRKKFLSLVVVLFLFTGSFDACNTADKETLLFPEIKPWDLKSLKITDKNNGVLLFKRKDCVWTLGEENLAANEALVTRLADHIVGITYQKYIAGNESMYANYMVGQDSFTYRVDIGLPEGEIKTLYLGSAPGYGLIYARTTGDENIYVLSKAAIKSITMASDSWLPEKDSPQTD